MKKILTFALVLATASIASAASLNWSMSGIMDYATGTQKTAGYAVYLFITEQSSDFGAKTTTISDVETMIKNGSALTDYIAASATSNAGGAVSGATGYNGTNFGAGDSLTAFAVIFNGSDIATATHYKVTDTKSASWTSSNGAKAVAFGSQANSSWTAVPEPSTAVLALAGLALLLKRRRA